VYVESRVIEVPQAEAQERAVHVDISISMGGGWNVTTTCDGRILATRHYNDWHRVERARILLECDLRTDGEHADSHFKPTHSEVA
jgi:hypothetical protein